jgi:hypothetical protein
MRYLNRLEAQLVAASRELSGAPAPTPAGRSASVWTLIRRHTYLSTALAIATLAATGAIADAAGLFAPPDLSSPSPLGTATTIPSDLASSYAILRRSREPADALPPGTNAIAVGGGTGAHYGINVSLSRFVGTINGTRMWLVAGSTGACMYTADQGGACAATKTATTQGLVGTQVPVAGGADTFIGLIPDDATITATNTDGTPAPIKRSGNAFAVTGDPDLHTVTIHEPSGHDLVLPAPAPPKSAELAAPGGTLLTAHLTGRDGPAISVTAYLSPDGASLCLLATPTSSAATILDQSCNSAASEAQFVRSGSRITRGSAGGFDTSIPREMAWFGLATSAVASIHVRAPNGVVYKARLTVHALAQRTKRGMVRQRLYSLLTPSPRPGTTWLIETRLKDGTSRTIAVHVNSPLFRIHR